MIEFCIAAISLLVLAVLYLLAISGRRNHPGLKDLRGWSYAHRGLHNGEVPENSLAAFAAAADRGFGMELDVHLLKDGTLAILHDYSLFRTTGQPGQIEDLTREDLGRYYLDGSQQTIPTLEDVLRLVDGRTPLIIELKVAKGNYAPLCQAVCDLLQTYSGLYCLESFDPRCIFWLRRHHPQQIRGLLAENYCKTNGPLPWFMKFALTHHLGNLIARPDFIAYRFPHRKNFATFLVRKLWGVQGVSWTITAKEDFDIAVQEGWIPIFEQFLP